MTKDYKGFTIELNEFSGMFGVDINGIYKKFASLKSAMNAIDKSTVVNFKPMDVLTVDSKGWHPSFDFITKTKLVSYTEEKGYRRGSIIRYYVTSTGDKIEIDGAEIYPLSARANLQKNLDEKNKLEKIVSAAEKKMDVLEKAREKMVVSYDPKPY